METDTIFLCMLHYKTYSRAIECGADIIVLVRESQAVGTVISWGGQLAHYRTTSQASWPDRLPDTDVM